MNYETAEAELIHRGHGGKMRSRKMENNTYLERRTIDEIALRLHGTDIITFRSDGSAVLDSGGWLTVTTKNRIDGYLGGFSISSARLHRRAESYWWVTRSRGTWLTDQDNWIPFFDGLELNQNTGAVLSDPEKVERIRRQREPEPTNREKIGNYLSFLLDPDAMATFASDWEVSALPERVPGPVDSVNTINNHPHMAANLMLEYRYFDMGVAMKAIELDMAVRGEWERSSHWEAMEWAQLMGEGKEPHRFRSVMRRLIRNCMADA